MVMRRVALLSSLALWLGMLGALGYREYTRSGRESDDYVEALFGKDAPVLVSKSVWLRNEMTGVENRIGFLEMQLTQFAGRDVHVRHKLNLEADKLPREAISFALKNLLGADVPIEDLEGQLDAYVNRRLGLRRLSGELKFGSRKFDFFGRPVGSRYMKVTTWANGKRSSNLVDFNRRLPFGTGSSPFLGMKHLDVGKSWKVTYFNPVDRKANARLIRVVGRETLEYRKKPVECFVLTSHPIAGTGSGGSAASFGSPTSKAWVSVKRGQLLREETSMLIFRLAMVLEESVTAEERNYRRTLESPLEQNKRSRRPRDRSPEREPEHEHDGGRKGARAGTRAGEKEAEGVDRDK